MREEIRIYDEISSEEIARRQDLLEMYKASPIPDTELLSNLGLFISKREFSRMLYIHEIYSRMIEVPGIIVEFGTRWGQNLALFETLRGIYEPYNRLRKIVGFDTFEGLPSVSDKDVISVGSLNVTENYELYLGDLLDLHEREGAIPHDKGYELIRGDASIQIKNFLDKHPETIIALAYFDMVLYEPTRACLEAIQGCLTKGSIIAFDQLNCDLFPGETIALKEVLGLAKYKLAHSQYSSARSYLVID